jgi:geranylgeranylglycerol-phosphate geranylgeranyltransferase
MSLQGLLALTRPVNAVAAGLGAPVGYLIATGTLTPGVLFLVAGAGLITAAGNAINDYFDADIDRINRPDRPIPSGRVTPRGAFTLSAFLFLAGILVCIPAGPLCLAIALVNSLFLFLYAARLKRVPLAGNLAVAYLSGSLFLFGGALAGMVGVDRTLALALITFLAMMSREILKASEDLEGDQAFGAVTIPAVVGVPRSSLLALSCAIGAVAVSLLPMIPWWSPLYLVSIAVPDLLILGGAGSAVGCSDGPCVRSSKATIVLKAGMFLALAVICGAALVGGTGP